MTSIDIVMPVYRALPQTERAVESVLAFTDVPFRLIIADDYSHDAAQDRFYQRLEQDHQVIVLRGTRRRGFGDVCNWAVKNNVQGERFCLLNSDVVVTPGWMGKLLAAGDSPHVGVVGCKLLFPKDKGAMANKIQHFGVARMDGGLPYHPFRGQPFNHPPTMKTIEVNCVTGACMLIRSTCWLNLRGFDRAYEFAQFEDVDFCWRAREEGWKIVLSADAVLFHEEHGSGENYAMLRHDVNRRTLLKRWGHLKADHELFGPGGEVCS